MTLRGLYIAAFLLILSCTALQAGQNASLIHSVSGHRDLSLPALLLANLEHPDFMELPVVLTSDNELLVYNARVLQPYTNVAQIFPQRQRDDGNFYVIDFTLAEIEQLSYADYQTNSPTHDIAGRLAGLDDTLHVLAKASAAIGTSFRPIVVIKYPWFHRRAGRDISAMVLDKLPERFFDDKTTLYLKCFDPDELKRIASMPVKELAGEVTLILGIDQKDGQETKRWKREEWVSYNDDWLFTRLGLRVAAGYTDAFSITDINRVDASTLRRFVEDSHSLDLLVFLAVPRDTLGNTTTSTSATVDDAVDTPGQAPIFELDADGFIYSEIRKLRGYLATRQHSSIFFPPQKLQPEQPALPEQAPAPNVEKNGRDDAPALLSDPAKLSERLKKMQ